MRAFKVIIILSCMLLYSSMTMAIVPFSAQLCDQSDYSCIRAHYGESWESLFPNPVQRDIVKRINRMNTPLYQGRLLAIPNDLPTLQVTDISPFASQINPMGEKAIIYDPKQNAWAAYDVNGQLVKWGPGSSGADWCSDINQPCHTQPGVFTVYRKGGPDCVSKTYPLPNGGAPMPYCVFFNKGFALHGSYEVPGFNASHGCVRMFVGDAQWLNQSFVDLGRTKVIILPYN